MWGLDFVLHDPVAFKTKYLERYTKESDSLVSRKKCMDTIQDPSSVF